MNETTMLPLVVPSRHRANNAALVAAPSGAVASDHGSKMPEETTRLSSWHELVEPLLHANIIHPEDWHSLPSPVSRSILTAGSSRDVLEQLLQHGLITDHQKSRIEAGTTYGLTLGNYRVLDRLGDGGMAVVFRAEHMDLRHQVAIKVLPVNSGQDPALRSRFSSEMRTIAQLHHPNIVAALDAGRVVGPDSLSPQLWYLVMEYVSGMDLERYINTHGPLVPARAANLIHQIACALVETNKRNLVHRDIKPSNIMIVGEDVAKLLDFGLSRNYQMRQTEPGVVLGTIDYMAPEQARDASAVDIRADLYGLGGTLYWCLTGRLPFPGGKNIVQCLTHRQTAPPPSARAVRPEIPAELDDIIARMMATDPEDRFESPEAVLRALLPFLRPYGRSHNLIALHQFQDLMRATTETSRILQQPATQQVLIVDDNQGVRDYARRLLESTAGVNTLVAEDGLEAIEMVQEFTPDLVLLDMGLPGISGRDVLLQLRELNPYPHLKIIAMSGQLPPDELAELLNNGADDFLHKPFSVMQLQRRVQSALRLKEVQDRALLLNQHLLLMKEQLEKALTLNTTGITSTRDAVLTTLTRSLALRDASSPSHGIRLQHYCRTLAEQAIELGFYREQLTEDYISLLSFSAPLHDVGKSGLPDHILLKPGKLTTDERMLMQTHTTLGGELLRSVAEQHPGAAIALQMAIDIAENHHERWDGTGYPNLLAGTAIPLSARIVTIGDVYDALRSRRIYKPALSHASAVQMISEGAGSQFDPQLVQAFLKVAPEFERIYKEYQD